MWYIFLVYFLLFQQEKCWKKEINFSPATFLSLAKVTVAAKLSLIVGKSNESVVLLDTQSTNINSFSRILIHIVRYFFDFQFKPV